MLNDVVRHLAGSQQRSLSARVGEPIVYEIPPALRDASAVLKTPLSPAQPAVALTATPAGAAPTGQARGGGSAAHAAARPMELRYDRADNAGTYSLELALPDQTARQVLFARQVDPAEGDLTPGREPAIAAAVGTERLTYIDKQASEAAQVAKADAQKEYWMWALALLAALLAMETYLAQRFGHWPGGKKEEDLAQRAQRAQR
jgi:anti-sigma-K factor RskA